MLYVLKTVSIFNLLEKSCIFIPPSSSLSWKPCYAWQPLSQAILILSCFACVLIDDTSVSCYVCLDYLVIHSEPCHRHKWPCIPGLCDRDPPFE